MPSTEKPKITLETAMKNQVKVQVDNPLNLYAHVTGKPSPKVTWLKGNDILKSETIEEGRTSLKLPEVKSGGTYKIIAENEVGCDEAVIDVLMLGEFQNGTICILA